MQMDRSDAEGEAGGLDSAEEASIKYGDGGAGGNGGDWEAGKDVTC